MSMGLIQLCLLWCSVQMPLERILKNQKSRYFLWQGALREPRLRCQHTGPDKKRSRHAKTNVLPLLWTVIDTNLDTFIYSFKTNQWQLYLIGKDHIITPSVKGRQACTGVFNLSNHLWSAVDRTKEMLFSMALFNACLILILWWLCPWKWHNLRDDTIWEFDGEDFNWEEYSVKLPTQLVNDDTVVITLLNPS